MSIETRDTAKMRRKLLTFPHMVVKEDTQYYHGQCFACNVWAHCDGPGARQWVGWNLFTHIPSEKVL